MFAFSSLNMRKSLSGFKFLISMSSKNSIFDLKVSVPENGIWTTWTKLMLLVFSHHLFLRVDNRIHLNLTLVTRTHQRPVTLLRMHSGPPFSQGGSEY